VRAWGEKETWTVSWTWVTHFHIHDATITTSFDPRNCMVARTVIYLYIMSILGLCWCIEQPSSSLLEKHTAFQWLCKQTKVYRVPWQNISRWEPKQLPIYPYLQVWLWSTPSKSSLAFQHALHVQSRCLCGLEAMDMIASWLLQLLSLYI